MCRCVEICLLCFVAQDAPLYFRKEVTLERTCEGEHEKYSHSRSKMRALYLGS